MMYVHISRSYSGYLSFPSLGFVVLSTFVAIYHLSRALVLALHVQYYNICCRLQ